MERIRHIRDTQKSELLEMQTDQSETSAERAVVELEGDEEPNEILQHAITDESTTDQSRVFEILKQIDEKVLRDIFEEYFRQSGSDPETINWIPLSSFQLFDGAQYDAGAVYVHPDNKILIDYKAETDLTGILNKLVHEQVHAVTASADRSKPTGLNRDDVETSEEFLVAFNEGATEFITHKILDEYLRRTGSKYDGSSDIDTLSSFQYREYEKTFRAYVRLIAALAQAPLEVAEGGVIRNYFRNGDIVPAELSDELEEYQLDLTARLVEAFQLGEHMALVPIIMDLQKVGLLTWEEARSIMRME